MCNFHQKNLKIVSFLVDKYIVVGLRHGVLDGEDKMLVVIAI